MNNLSDNKIINALECCIGKSDCLSCPCEKGASIECLDDLHRYALDLINRQKAEIERLEKDSKRLKKVQMQLDDAMKMYSTIKTEAVKELIEKLTEEYKEYTLADSISIDQIFLSIKHIAKEMVGED